jgi:diguanylate cyclase (GGDEF)-like protein
MITKTTPHANNPNSKSVNRKDRLLSEKFTSAQLAVYGFVMVLLALSGFAILSSISINRLGTQASTSSILSDHYDSATAAVAAEESLERKYRLEPSPEVRHRYDAAGKDLVRSLTLVGIDGTNEDRVIVDRVLAAHISYLASIDRMFAAVDRSDTASVIQIDSNEVDPKFEFIEKIVASASEIHHTASIKALQRLREKEEFNVYATTVTFIIGLSLVVLFSIVLRNSKVKFDQQHEKAIHDSLYDLLTGLPNRALLNDRFEQALRSAHREKLTTGLLLLDLDRFKEVNDTLGHHYGDELLIQIGARLSGELRENDTIARLGGDEFAVLLPIVDGLDGAHMIAQRLRSALTKTFVIENVELEIEASVGVVISGQHGDDAETLLKHADVAMYAAKQQGQGVLVYDPDFNLHALNRLPLLAELRRGIERDELFMHYQPKVSLSSGKVTSVEALVRWKHPERGIVCPDEFIPYAEHTSIIGPLTRHVLNLSLTQVKAWADAGHHIPVAVNISARNLLDDTLVDYIINLLAHHSLSAQMLEIEVTESAIMHDPKRAQNMLSQLQALGIRIAIDDFGAGYTSLAQLKNLPVNDLKIDKSFVLTMQSDASNALIVKSVIDLGHNLRLSVIAEGVETADALSALTGYRCDIAQGYHLSRPQTAEDFLRWYCEREGIVAQVT